MKTDNCKTMIIGLLIKLIEAVLSVRLAVTVMTVELFIVIDCFCSFLRVKCMFSLREGFPLIECPCI